MFSSDIKEALLKIIETAEKFASSPNIVLQNRALDLLERAMTLLEDET